jgi:hypothetical protein
VPRIYRREQAKSRRKGRKIGLFPPIRGRGRARKSAARDDAIREKKGRPEAALISG